MLDNRLRERMCGARRERSGEREGMVAELVTPEDTEQDPYTDRRIALRYSGEHGRMSAAVTAGEFPTTSYGVPTAHSTFAAAAAGLGSGAVLMPAFGVTGAAVSFLISYVTLAAVAGFFAQRHYRMTYEKGRIVRVVNFLKYGLRSGT